MKAVVRGARVVLPGGVGPASIHVEDGRIARVADYSLPPPGVADVDAGDLVILPGLVDTHVHVNDPGRADWEGFEHATRAAAAGGVTTLVDMPLNSIPATTTLDGLREKRRAASGRCYVDVGFWGGVVPGNAGELEPLAANGVLGFKCFLVPSGVDEFRHVTEADLREALPILARLDLPLLVHAELPEALRQPDPGGDPRQYRTWLETRPPESELAAIRLLVGLARDTGAHIHVVHLAAADAIPPLRAARTNGVRISVETCPHYLTFAAEEIRDGATAAKCAPPIRTAGNRARLWKGLLDGDIDLVATDHSPAPPSLKRLEDGDFLAAWGGIASLQLGLAAVWTGARASVSWGRVAAWMCTRPAALAGLSRKGAIAEGCDADLVFWDPDVETIVDPSALYHRHHVTPYAGMRLRGRVRRTLLRGEVVFDGEQVLPTPRGRQLLGRKRGHSTFCGNGQSGHRGKS